MIETLATLGAAARYTTMRSAGGREPAVKNSELLLLWAAKEQKDREKRGKTIAVQATADPSCNYEHSF
jgi:hypothetical protein